mgnify:CR=1 FL=1
MCTFGRPTDYPIHFGTMGGVSVSEASVTGVSFQSTSVRWEVPEVQYDTYPKNGFQSTSVRWEVFGGLVGHRAGVCFQSTSVRWEGMFVPEWKQLQTVSNPLRYDGRDDWDMTDHQGDSGFQSTSVRWEATLPWLTCAPLTGFQSTSVRWEATRKTVNTKQNRVSNPLRYDGR